MIIFAGSKLRFDHTDLLLQKKPLLHVKNVFSFQLFPCPVITDLAQHIFCHIERQRSLEGAGASALALAARGDALTHLVPHQPGRGQPGKAGPGRSAATTDSPSAAKDSSTHNRGEGQACWKRCPGGGHRLGIESNKDGECSERFLCSWEAAYL